MPARPLCVACLMPGAAAPPSPPLKRPGGARRVLRSKSPSYVRRPAYAAGKESPSVCLYVFPLSAFRKVQQFSQRTNTAPPVYVRREHRRGPLRRTAIPAARSDPPVLAAARRLLLETDRRGPDSQLNGDVPAFASGVRGKHPASTERGQ